jgi:hypothetical protein
MNERDVLEALLGLYIGVRSQAGKADYRDDGGFEDYDARRLVLKKDSGLIYFPIANVRLVKPL